MTVKTIAEQLFFTTVKIEGDNSSTGTGFIFSYQYNGGDYLFIVTNKHVLDDIKKVKLSFLENNDDTPILGSVVPVMIDNFDKGLWYGHENNSVDIAIIPLAPIVRTISQKNKEVFFRTINLSLLPSKEQLENEIDAIEDIIFVGYPNGMWDNANFLPIARRGTTATSMVVDFDAEKKFLIDASVFPGSSGSPVFLYNHGMYAKKSGGTVVGDRLLFVGVVSSVYFRNKYNEVIPLPIPTTKLISKDTEMIDLGVVIKYECVVECIEQFMQKKGIRTDGAS